MKGWGSCRDLNSASACSDISSPGSDGRHDEGADPVPQRPGCSTGRSVVEASTSMLMFEADATNTLPPQQLSPDTQPGVQQPVAVEQILSFLSWGMDE